MVTETISDIYPRLVKYAARGRAAREVSITAEGIAYCLGNHGLTICYPGPSRKQCLIKVHVHTVCKQSAQGSRH